MSLPEAFTAFSLGLTIIIQVAFMAMAWGKITTLMQEARGDIADMRQYAKDLHTMITKLFERAEADGNRITRLEARHEFATPDLERFRSGTHER
jgi:hypothetical protein